MGENLTHPDSVSLLNIIYFDSIFLNSTWCMAGVLVAHAMELFADDEATILSPRGFYV
jgi:hypothetical protein